VCCGTAVAFAPSLNILDGILLLAPDRTKAGRRVMGNNRMLLRWWGGGRMMRLRVQMSRRGHRRGRLRL
jgi:hypothetical protein